MTQDTLVDNATLDLPKTITKRNGKVVPFDTLRISNALDKVFTEIKEEISTNDKTEVVLTALAHLVGHKDLGVEQIQDVVVLSLMEKGYYNAALAYTQYRTKHNYARQEKDVFAKQGLDILEDRDTQSQRDNANVPRNTMSSKIEIMKRLNSKRLALEYIVPKAFKEAHERGEIYVHDMDAVITKHFNCCNADYPNMLKGGFQMGNKFIEEPSLIETTMNVLVQAIQCQSTNQFGGLSIIDLDIHLAKYIEENHRRNVQDIIDYENARFQAHPLSTSVLDDTAFIEKMAWAKTKKQMYKACRLLSYQINTLSVRGESSPFVTITYGKGTGKYERLIQQSILEERFNECSANGVQEFPKHQFNVDSKINAYPGTPNYDLFQLACKVSAMSCYPDFIFPENQLLHTGGSAGYMGCRSLLPPWKNEDGELVYLGRANAGVCTVNLPHAALETLEDGGDIDDFIDLVCKRTELAMDVGEWRYNRLIKTKAKDNPFTYTTGLMGMVLDPEETVERVFANGRATVSVGYIGLHEVVLAFMGEAVRLDNEKAIAFQVRVMEAMNDTIAKRRAETGIYFSLYGTPAESLTDRFCQQDKERFGVIPGITDKGFYVNSYHVDTELKISPFEKIAIEANFQKLSTGGHISYVEANQMKDNLPAYEKLVIYAFENKLMHFGINSPWDFCKSCHWTGEIPLVTDEDHKYKCPECGETDPDKIVMIRRMNGYIARVDTRPPVLGRVKEIISRVKHEE